MSGYIECSRGSGGECSASSGHRCQTERERGRERKREGSTHLDTTIAVHRSSLDDVRKVDIPIPLVVARVNRNGRPDPAHFRRCIPCSTHESQWPPPHPNPSSRRPNPIHLDIRHPPALCRQAKG